MDELASRVQALAKSVDSQVESYLVIGGDEELLAMLELPVGLVENLTITHFDQRVIWDFADGHREVAIDGDVLVRSEDGTWEFSERVAWSPLFPHTDWTTVQDLAVQCLEGEPVVAGPEVIAGVATIHLVCVDQNGTLSFWVDETGLVMKLVSEGSWEGSPILATNIWEVIARKVEPEGPLPPGW